MAKAGGRGGASSGGQEILTSLRSTTSHGVSPRCHNQSRKPAYSIAERRVSHSTFPWAGKRPSSPSPSERPAPFPAIPPGSFLSHFSRDDASDGSVGPKTNSVD